MFSRFFIHRPIFACVISIVIVLAGVVAQSILPVAQYPNLSPPVVRVSCNYPGASAQVVADTVAAPIEQEVNGVENMLYMSSTSSSNGSYQLDVTFDLGTNSDIASVLVQNRVSVANAKLPDEVKRQGITTKKQSSSMVAILTLSPKDQEAAKIYDDLYLANYVVLNVRDRLARIRGVGDVSYFPSKDYGMRIWLDPEKLKARGLVSSDVLAALREQNVQVAAGSVGLPPTPSDVNFQYTVTTLGRLASVEQFENVILKRGDDGRLTFLKDVARVELGAKSYDTSGRLNDGPAAIIVIYQTPDGNAVQIASEIRKTMADMEKSLPQGLDFKMRYDISDFVNAAIHEVYKTLYEAVILVVLVVLVFLGSFRTTLVPIATIPVALIGTFIMMAVFGFSINMLTLFGLVLAIGIVVDDAIVVVENVERNMVENHMDPKPATERAMGEVFSAVIAISLVLMSVFLPTAALPGITGQMYRQFALTIAVSTAFSAINALTLSPALCGVLLKPHDPNHKPNAFNRGFNAFFDKISGWYDGLVRFLVHPYTITFTLAGFVAVLAATVFVTKSVPAGFLPEEDRGLIMVEMILPDSASMSRADDLLKQVQTMVKNTEGVMDVAGMGGYSILNGAGSNYAFGFAMLKPWEERLPKGRDLNTILKDIRQKGGELQEGLVMAFSLPVIDGLGFASGFDMRVQDRAGVGRAVMGKSIQDLVVAANQQSSLRSTRSAFRAAVPSLFANIDREKVKKLDVPLQNVFDALSTNLGAAYVNDFNKFGRTYQVNMQADSVFRSSIEDVGRLEVKNRSGQMIPLGSLLKMEESFSPDRVFRYNLYPAGTINGEPAAGVSSGQSLEVMEELAAQNLPTGMGFEWTGMSYQEKKQSGQGNLVFLLAIIMVYLILAAQYESWTTPLAIVLSIPLAVIGAMIGCMINGQDNNVYTQVGLVLLVGLGAKNAILIVEFSRENIHKGMALVDATALAARQRLRPILMTSFAFIAGVYPLVHSTGAGAASRVALGTAVFYGMIGSTILGLVFTPMLYVLIMRIVGTFSKNPAGGSTPGSPDHSGHEGGAAHH